MDNPLDKLKQILTDMYSRKELSAYELEVFGQTLDFLEAGRAMKKPTHLLNPLEKFWFNFFTRHR